jgi:hypothetical protein
VGVTHVQAGPTPKRLPPSQERLVGADGHDDRIPHFRAAFSLGLVNQDYLVNIAYCLSTSGTVPRSCGKRFPAPRCCGGA